MRRHRTLHRERPLYSDPRVDVLEADVGNLAARVETGFKDVAFSLRNISESVASLAKDVASKPQPIPFKEILTTAATILAVVAYINNFYEVQSTKNLAPTVKELEITKLRLDRIEMRLQK